MKMTLIPIIAGALETIPYSSLKGLEELEIGRRAYVLIETKQLIT